MRQRIRFCRSSDGTRIAYAVHGHGPALVKAGHWLTHVEHDWRSPIWQPRLAALGQRYTFVRYDCRDTGLSDREVERISLDAWVEDLSAVVDAVGLRTFSLLGTAQGGPTAIAYACRHPDRVQALVLHGTFAQGRSRRESARAGETDAAAVLTRHWWAEENAAVRQMWTARLIPSGRPEHVQWLNDLQRRSASAAAAVRSYRTSTTIDVSEQARAVRVPTLVLHSRGDTFVPFEAGRELAAMIPGAAFVPLPSDNHILLTREPAWADFLAELDAFLAATGTRAEGWDGGEGPVTTSLAGLSRREAEVLRLVANGLANDEIAGRLHLSSRTVERHLANIYTKLGLSGRSARAAAAARLVQFELHG